MAILAPFVVKLYSYSPSEENCAKNVAHIGYIATRPGVDQGELEPKKDEEIHVRYMHERPGSQGLFDKDGIADLNAVESELKNHKGVVWRGVVSLREDEATRINHLDKSDWANTLQRSFPEIADKLGVSESNLRWVAAYHPEAGHPHCHIVFWEQKPQRLPSRFSRAELRNIRKIMTKKTYECERERLRIEKTYFRDSLQGGVRDILGLRKGIDEAAKLVKAEIGDRPGLSPRMSEQQAQELIQKLHNLSDKLPGRGKAAFKYMPQEVKAEIRDIADWVLRQPGFRQETEKYLEAHTQMTKIYTFQKSFIDKARKKAYGDLRKRISQDLLKAAVRIQRQNKIGEKRESSPHEGHNIGSQDIPDIGLQDSIALASPSKDHGRGGKLSKPEKETREWCRSVFRLVERERARAGYTDRLKLPKFNGYPEGLKKLQEIAKQIPEDFKGRAVIAYLPDELKQQAREAADWLLSNPDIQKPLQDYLETTQHDPVAYNQIRDRVAENALFHALRLLNREIPNVEMVLHSQRAIMAIEQISKAAADVVRDDPIEARWTLGKIHEALTKIEASKERTQDIVTQWAKDAGIEISINSVLQRTYDGENDLDFMGKKDWNHLRDNLGYHEHELLNPWMGKTRSVEEPEPEKEEKERDAPQPVKPINPPDLVSRYIPAALEAFNSVAKPELLLDKEELQWTIWTSSWVLKELGVDSPTRLQILNNWAQRSGIEISMARVADIVHRSNLTHEENIDPRWLGQGNWERLMRNIGANNVPERPWQYPSIPSIPFNWAGTIWKGLWQSVQRERTKAEFQARRLEFEQERERQEKSKGRRER